MSEINVTDQRPKTTTAQMPEGMRAKAPLPKDPELVKFIAKLKAQFLSRVTPERHK